MLSSVGFKASKPPHGVHHHLLTAPGPPVYSKPRRLDPEKLSTAKEEFSAMELSGDHHLPGCLLFVWLRRKMEDGGPVGIIVD